MGVLQLSPPPTRMIIVLKTQGLCPFQTGACREKCCRPVTIMNTISLTILFTSYFITRLSTFQLHTIIIDICILLQHLECLLYFCICTLLKEFCIYQPCVLPCSICLVQFTLQTLVRHMQQMITKFLFFSCFRLINVLKAVKVQKKNSLRDSLHSVLQHLRLKLVVVFCNVCQVNNPVWSDVKNCACS